jgi:hypothetical protein
MVGSFSSLGMVSRTFAKSNDSWPTIKLEALLHGRVYHEFFDYLVCVRRRAFLQRFARCVIEACLVDMVVFEVGRVDSSCDET